MTKTILTGFITEVTTIILQKMVFQSFFTLPEPMQIIIKPQDTPDKIEYDLLEMRSRLIFYTAWNIANRDKRLVVDPKPEKACF